MTLVNDDFAVCLAVFPRLLWSLVRRRGNQNSCSSLWSWTAPSPPKLPSLPCGGAGCVFILNCDEYDPNGWPLRGHESASPSCGAVTATPIAAGVFGYARGKNSCVSTTPRGSSHRRSIGNRADCARRGGSLPLKTCSLPHGRAVLRGWWSDCRWSTRSFCRGRSRGFTAAAGEDFPKACGNVGGARLRHGTSGTFPPATSWAAP